MNSGPFWLARVQQLRRKLYIVHGHNGDVHAIGQGPAIEQVRGPRDAGIDARPSGWMALLTSSVSWAPSFLPMVNRCRGRPTSAVPKGAHVVFSGWRSWRLWKARMASSQVGVVPKP